MTCQNARWAVTGGIYQSDRICFLLLRTDRKCSSFSCTGNDKGSKDQFKNSVSMPITIIRLEQKQVRTLRLQV